jgi:hypothetical protein
MALQLIAAGGVLYWCWRQYRRLKVASGGADILVCPSPGVARSRQECLPHPFQKGAASRLLLLIFSSWVSWQLFFGPGSEQLTYGIIAPAASWAVIVSFDEKRARWLTVTAWVMLAVFASGDLEACVRLVFPAGKIFLPLGVVLFAAWLLWHERGPSRQEQELLAEAA